MKILKLSSLTVSAFALVLAAPDMADAKGIIHHSELTHAARPAVHSIDKTTSGVIDTTKNGIGTYTRTVTGTGADKTITTTDTFANGKAVTSTDVVTNSDGVKTSNATSVLADGKTVSRDETLTSTGTAGDYTVSGTVTQANGTIDTIAAGSTKDVSVYGTDSDLTLDRSTAKGVSQSETVNIEGMKSGDASATIETGTGFKGQTIAAASLQTTNATPTTNTVDTTVDGAGTYTASIGTVNGTTTTTMDRSFNDGTTTTSSTATTANPGGGTTYGIANTYTASGSTTPTYSNNLNEVMSASVDGTEQISGGFSQNNGYGGTLAGTRTATAYGTYTTVVYTDAAGSSGTATKTTNTEQLKVGDAILNVNTGTNFAGPATPSNGLITGAAATGTY